MKRKRFAEVVENIDGAGEIGRAKENPDVFIDLAATVAVPSGKKGASWKAIKAATWRHRATARK
jgi:hypothetical protein